MESTEAEAVPEIYPQCWARMPEALRQDLLERPESEKGLPEWLEAAAKRFELPGYLPELARLEAAAAECAKGREAVPRHPLALGLNPSLSMLHLDWTGLVELLEPGAEPGASQEGPELGETQALLWWDPHAGRVRVQTAATADLLILKIVAEGLDPVQVAREQALRPSVLQSLLQQAKAKGLVLGPAPSIRRPPGAVPVEAAWADRYRSPEIFTLQWHLTQACDLHCRHCYDRSSRREMPLEAAMRVLQELEAFCARQHVRGQITFTGGNPLLSKHFFRIYEAAAERGFILAILGNPADNETLERLAAIERPALYQVSLEGLEPHNDEVRQAGHYRRTLDFLDQLQSFGIHSQVMLTLTEANLDQVLPLGEVLRGRTGRLSFNRLSMVGEGAGLRLPDPKAYREFLQDYLDAAQTNPVLGLKDNLLNQALLDRGAKPFGGCTGFGCGAAFNFLTLLPEGEVHACRKLPSPLGSIHTQSLEAIYDGTEAEAYRQGPEACRTCSIRPVCRGCAAVTYGLGLDVFKDRDPFCPGPVHLDGETWPAG